MTTPHSIASKSHGISSQRNLTPAARLFWLCISETDVIIAGMVGTMIALVESLMAVIVGMVVGMA